ncbi:uncharacterized protein LOC108670877 [Hyalella azteca]|uniref:protein-serine/threonine phosphatase n=2 Tax=Hyalella azteca TaxID=294128 RepID=A0A8B7NJM5_HYAAZ|nr:uncharacterized protein LOC108670877 [Hyalella azteca]
MEKMYKDILIVRCRPSSRDSSADRQRSVTGSPQNGFYSGLNGLSKTASNKINDTFPKAYNHVSRLDAGTVNDGHKSSHRNLSNDSSSSNQQTYNNTSRLVVSNGFSNGHDVATIRNSRLDQNCNLVPRKKSAPGIAITAGGFHFDGHVPRDDYLPQYLKLLQCNNARSNETVDAIKSVPVSPFAARRWTSIQSGQPPPNNLNLRRGRASVTVLTDESPRSSADRCLWSPSDDKFLKHPLSKISVINAGLSLAEHPDPSSSLINSAAAAGSAAGFAAASAALNTSSVTASPFDHWSHVPRSPVAERRRSKIGNKNSRKSGAGVTATGSSPLFSNGAMSGTEKAKSEVSVRDLTIMLQSVKPDVGPLPGHEMDRTPRYLAGVCMDECYPGLYIGDIGAAKDRAYLQRVGITHVLNTAEGKKMCTVDTNAEYYKEVNIKYLGLELLDIPSANISQFFEQGAQFIDDCLSSGGKVLVHCFMGISRSSTIAAAFLMLRRNMGVMEALTTLRRRRSIYPNDGFLHQLVQLDSRLAKQRKATPKP